MKDTRVFIQTYGCRMNACDTEIICAILRNAGFSLVHDSENADVAILNCCSVREDGHIVALDKALKLKQFNRSIKTVLCGCFAKLVDSGFLRSNTNIDAVVTPESYREMPGTLSRLVAGDIGFIVSNEISDDLYQEILPIEYLNIPNRALILGKGCNQKCAYCIEPYTRGAERYVNLDTVMANLDVLFHRHEGGIVTLVGHMVDRYMCAGVNFAMLLREVAKECERHNVWVKYLSSHPMTYSDEVLSAVSDCDNVMRVVHLPVQSGSNEVLNRMRRGYTVEQYLETIGRVRAICPDMNIVTDIMVGFCGETDSDFRQSVELIEQFRPGEVNVYAFSMRSNTYAHRAYIDDVTEDIKRERMQIAIDVASRIRREYMQSEVGMSQKFMSGAISGTNRRDFSNIYNRTYSQRPGTRDCGENLIVEGRLSLENNLFAVDI